VRRFIGVQREIIIEYQKKSLEDTALLIKIKRLTLGSLNITD
jgi:hypothetical protein